MGEKRVNIGLKEKTHTQAKLLAILKNVPLQKFLEDAIEDAVRKDKKLLEELAK